MRRERDKSLNAADIQKGEYPRSEICLFIRLFVGLLSLFKTSYHPELILNSSFTKCWQLAHSVEKLKD